MTKRTTIELDEQLVERAKRALGCRTTRDTVHTALRLAAEKAEEEHRERRERQIEFFKDLHMYVDMDVLASEEMWR